MIELPGAIQNGSSPGFSSLQLMQVLTKQSQALGSHKANRSERLYQEIKNKLDIYSMQVSKYHAERAMANQESRRVMSSLSGKFSLISKIQQSMG
ncbi:hypothetical protein AB838_05895 [Rhodobacteraceae bacterium (ex Bugula neritina AB1)]|nr:hypothetical protein AB838_05895 [Rhodobacteraceae bacterium (ex Bugula neritina AB1)]